jgi:hypothetical protein
VQALDPSYRGRALLCLAIWDNRYAVNQTLQYNVSTGCDEKVADKAVPLSLQDSHTHRLGTSRFCSLKKKKYSAFFCLHCLASLGTSNVPLFSLIQSFHLRSHRPDDFSHLLDNLDQIADDQDDLGFSFAVFNVDNSPVFFHRVVLVVVAGFEQFSFQSRIAAQEQLYDFFNSHRPAFPYDSFS